MTHDFNTIRRTAWHLTNSLARLEKPLEQEQQKWLWKDRQRECLAIAGALDIIARTPNASVSQEVLAALDKRLEEAHAALSDWCERLLEPQPPGEQDIEF